jgi:hypothetical protein
LSAKSLETREEKPQVNDIENTDEAFDVPYFTL